jgi:hypothetical protein
MPKGPGPLIDHPAWDHVIVGVGRFLEALGFPRTVATREAQARLDSANFPFTPEGVRRAYELQRQQERELVVPFRQEPYQYWHRDQYPFFPVAFTEDDDVVDTPTESFSARPEGAWQAYRAGERADLRTISFMMGLTLDPDPTAPFGGRDVHGWTDTGVLTGTGKGTSPNAPSTDNGGITGAVAGPAPDTGANAPDANSQAE